jgi:hypothetical protein
MSNIREGSEGKRCCSELVHGLDEGFVASERQLNVQSLDRHGDQQPMK